MPQTSEAKLPAGSLLMGRLRRSAFTAAMAGTLVSICLIFASLMRDAHREVGHSAALSTANLASSLAHDVERSADVLDRGLQAALQAWNDARVQALPADLRDLILFDNAAKAPGFGAVLVLDRTGAIRASSRPALLSVHLAGNRDYFLVHEQNSDVGLFVSRPFISQISHQWVIALSRRINNPDGSFGGVVVGTLQLAYLDTLYNSVDLGQDGAAALLRLDGTIVTRVPFNDGDARRNVHALEDTFNPMRALKTGSVIAPSPIDGRNRIISFHRVGNLPLIQDVEMAVDDAYASWWDKALVLGLVLFALCTVCLTLQILLSKELVRRTAAEAELERLASTDPLTRLANRRHFEEALAREWARAVRSGLDLAVLMIDADFFKFYNDRFGHPAGDDLLKRVAECIRTSVHRPTDLPCRIGGEEFAVVLPDTDEAGALAVAETIRSSVEGLGAAHPLSPFGIVTVSIGVASRRPRRNQMSEEAVSAADLALYRAKDEGRNRVQRGEEQKHIALVA